MGGEIADSAAAMTIMHRVIMKPLRRPMISASAPKMSCPSTAPTSAAVETIDFSLGTMFQWQSTTPQRGHVREPCWTKTIPKITHHDSRAISFPMIAMTMLMMNKS